MKRNSIYFRDPHIQKMIFDPTLIPLLAPSYKNGQKMVKRPEFLQLYKNAKTLPTDKQLSKSYPHTKMSKNFTPNPKKFTRYTKNYIFKLKCNFRDPHIKNAFSRPPHNKNNGIFETPHTRKCIFETPTYKKWQFRDPIY